MDIEKLNLIKFHDVSFGGKFDRGFGHERCLRAAMLNKYGEKMGRLTDSELSEKITNDGYLPVVINEYDDGKETVYLVEKKILAEAIQLKR